MHIINIYIYTYTVVYIYPIDIFIPPLVNNPTVPVPLHNWTNHRCQARMKKNPLPWCKENRNRRGL